MRLLKYMASFALLGCIGAGALGHHDDAEQWAAVAAGALVGSIIFWREEEGPPR